MEKRWVRVPTVTVVLHDDDDDDDDCDDDDCDCVMRGRSLCTVRCTRALVVENKPPYDDGTASSDDGIDADAAAPDAW